MASNYTSNYGLCQWKASDKVLRTEFNADNAKLDAALAGKASVLALNSLSAVVDGKASASALNALTQTVSGHTDTLAKKGNCRICVETYTGTGLYGSGHPTTVTFPAKPWLVIFSSERGWTVPAVRGVTSLQCFGAGNPAALSGSWSGNSVSLTAANANVQMNYENEPYTVLAFIDIAE